jgi:hypothetical protein
MDVARSGTSKRHVAHGAGRPIRSAHGRVAPRIPRALAPSTRCAPLADDQPESPASCLRRWLRIGSSIQPRLQARVRHATGAISAGAEGRWLSKSFPSLAVDLKQELNSRHSSWRIVGPYLLTCARDTTSSPASCSVAEAASRS